MIPFLIGVSFMGYIIPNAFLILLGILGAFIFCHHIFSEGLLPYVFKRIIEALITIFVIASVTFLLLRLLPGGPFDGEKSLPPEIKKNIEAKYNLDAPLAVQYFDYLKGLVKGDLGDSYKFLGRSVKDIILETIPFSFQLGIYALFLAFLLGIPAGIFSASRHNRASDHLTMFFAISGVSLPIFAVAPFFILFFCFYLDWLPPAFWEGPAYYILPVLTLGIRPASIIARLTRASVLEVIRSDYIRTARSKGLSDFTILFKHVLKNSLIPVLTFSGPLVAGVLSGSFVIELIFNIPGLGKHFVESVSNRDYPLILGVTFIFCNLLILANLIVDLLYSYFDPRIKLT